LIFQKRTKFSFRSGDKVFSDACLLSKNSKSVLSKAGRLAWVAQMDGQPVKIYECHNETQAIFIESVSDHILLRNFFPACLMRNGKYLVVKWIKGKEITRKQVMHDKRILDQIAHMQASIHSQSMDMSESTGFSYIDYLKTRLERFKGVFPLDQAIQRIYATIDKSADLVEQRISHPDLTPINLILEDGTGSLKIIDNELLTQNPYYLIDLFNTYHGFGKRARNRISERYLRGYGDNGGDLSVLIEHEHFFNTLWYLRLIGTYLQSGAVDKAFRLAQEYVQGSYSTHPLVELGREIIT